MKRTSVIPVSLLSALVLAACGGGDPLEESPEGSTATGMLAVETSSADGVKVTRPNCQVPVLASRTSAVTVISCVSPSARVKLVPVRMSRPGR